VPTSRGAMTRDIKKLLPSGGGCGILLSMKTKRSALKRLVTFIAFLTLIALCISGAFLCGTFTAYADDEKTAAVLKSDDERLSADYLAMHKIPTSLFTYLGNGGETSGYPLSYAFDGDEGTCFKSGQDNNVPYTDGDGNVITQNFINYIDIEFTQEITLDRVVFGCEKGITRGFPTIFNIYYENGDELTLAGKFTSSSTTNMVIFSFDEVTTKKIRLEYEKVETAHKYVATAREIMFLQPEDGDLFAAYKSLFTDYNKLTLSGDFSTSAKIAALDEKLQANLNYEELKERIDRAYSVLNGEITYDEKREFSTDPTAANVIERHGNVTNYARNDLKMAFFGTVRQVTGITATPGTEIKIYLEADEGDALSQIVFTQNKNHWSGWQSDYKTLKSGENTFTVPNLKTSNYSSETLSGGAIYIINPYTEAEQGENVRLYIEGGTLFPVFRSGDDESEYLEELSAYCDTLEEDEGNYFNLTELVSDHIILSLRATTANLVYSTEKSGTPQQAMDNWDTLIEELLEFGGVTMDETSPLYNEMNRYLNTNIRVTQPYAYMYAFYDHVGLCDSLSDEDENGNSLEVTALKCTSVGWGIVHELGHMFDINERTVSECSNNMWSMYNDFVLTNDKAHGNFDETYKALTNPDGESYFNKNRYNFLIWWYIETYSHGYWGNMENCYRGTNLTLKAFLEKDDGLRQTINSLNATEKQIFYSSLVTGIDLSYYFERWGYNLSSSDEVFTAATATNEFNSLIKAATEYGFIDGTKQPPLWLQGKEQYSLTSSGQPLYDQSQKAVLEEVTQNESGYLLSFEKSESPYHLAYAIYRSDDGGKTYNIIGYSQTDSYQDEYTGTETPHYKIAAIDVFYNTTAPSDELPAVPSDTWIPATAVAVTLILCAAVVISITTRIKRRNKRNKKQRNKRD